MYWHGSVLDVLIPRAPKRIVIRGGNPGKQEHSKEYKERDFYNVHNRYLLCMFLAADPRGLSQTFPWPTRPGKNRTPFGQGQLVIILGNTNDLGAHAEVFFSRSECIFGPAKSAGPKCLRMSA